MLFLLFLSASLFIYPGSPLKSYPEWGYDFSGVVRYGQFSPTLISYQTPAAQENLKQESNTTQENQKKDEELESLVKEIESIEEKDKASGKERKREGGAFQLNQLNPEISVTGDIFVQYTWRETPTNSKNSLVHIDTFPVEHEGIESIGSSGDHVFKVREVEFSFVSMLDPYSRMKVFLSYEEGTLHLEEAFIEYLTLPGHIRLGIGRQYQYLGLLNRWHSHAYPQIDRPPALQELVSEESLSQTGLHFQWLLPWWWSSSGEIIVEILMGDHEAFRGSDLKHPAWTIYLNNYLDLSQEWYLEFGGALAGGRTTKTPPLQRRIYNMFLRLNWTPIGRAKYRGFDLWIELFHNKQQHEKFIPLASPHVQWSSRWGGFAFIQYRINRRIQAGFRLDYVDGTNTLPKRWYYSPYLTIWQSEWVRLRIQYTLIHFVDQSTHKRILFQLTWAAGPHKHEAY